MTEKLSSNAAAIVHGSLQRITKREQLDKVSSIVGNEVGGLSLSLPGDVWDRKSCLQDALIEIAGAYVRTLAEGKLEHHSS